MVDTDSIVVGIDGSEGARRALRLAAGEAVLHGTGLEVLLAWDFLDQPAIAGREGFDPDFSQEEAQRLALAEVEEVLGASDLSVRASAVYDRPATVLHDAGRAARLEVVGSRGTGGFLGLRLGSVSQRLITHLPCPVLVVPAAPDEGPDPLGDGPGPADLQGGQVVVGVDGSDHARRALAWAATEARLRGASLTVVHAWSPPVIGTGAMAATGPPLDALEDSARALLREELAAVDTAGIDLEARVELAASASSLLDAASEADLVVVGARGRGALAGVVLGSVSQQVAHHAPCPLVIVPSGP